MSDEMKALRARLDRMQNLLASAKKDIADGKEQRAKIRDNKLQGIQDQAAALKKDCADVVQASKDFIGGFLPSSSSNVPDDKK